MVVSRKSGNCRVEGVWNQVKKEGCIKFVQSGHQVLHLGSIYEGLGNGISGKRKSINERYSFGPLVVF